MLTLVSGVQHSNSTSPYVMLCSPRAWLSLQSNTIPTPLPVLPLLYFLVPGFIHSLTGRLYPSPLYIHLAHPSIPPSLWQPPVCSNYNSGFCRFICFVSDSTYEGSICLSNLLHFHTFSTVAAPIYITTNSARGFFPHILANTCQFLF